MLRAKKWMNDNKVLILAAIVLGMAWLFVFSTVSAAAGPPWQNDIIRLHILAHDDTEAEQQLKLAIRDGVWQVVSGLVDNADSMAHARFIITKNLPEIEQAAQQIAADHGQSVHARLVPGADIPATSYAGIIFPHGRYEALQIIVGDGDGENWWCVMFPPMCLMDISRADVIETGANSVSARPRFRIAEIWQGLFE